MRKKLVLVALSGGLAFAIAVVGGIGGAGRTSVQPAHHSQALILHPDDPPIIKG